MTNNDDPLDSPIIDLNVGGTHYSTTLQTILKHQESKLAEMFSSDDSLVKLRQDAAGRYFIDRDGYLFRYILDFLRNNTLTLPEKFRDTARLKVEAEYYGLSHLVDILQSMGTSSGCITVAYRGSFSASRDGVTDVKFRKISKILVCGHVTLCRDVFGETLNESRDCYHSVSERYTSRFFLSHLYLEQAFDMLTEKGFKLRGACASSMVSGSSAQIADKSKSNSSDDARRDHYNEFIFVRD